MSANHCTIPLLASLVSSIPDSSFQIQRSCSAPRITSPRPDYSQQAWECRGRTTNALEQPPSYCPPKRQSQMMFQHTSFVVVHASGLRLVRMHSISAKRSFCNISNDARPNHGARGMKGAETIPLGIPTRNGRGLSYTRAITIGLFQNPRCRQYSRLLARYQTRSRPFLLLMTFFGHLQPGTRSEITQKYIIALWDNRSLKSCASLAVHPRHASTDKSQEICPGASPGLPRAIYITYLTRRPPALPYMGRPKSLEATSLEYTRLTPSGTPAAYPRPKQCAPSRQ